MKKRYRYCPICATKFVIKRLYDEKQLVCPKCGYIFYQNAKPAVAGFIIKGDKILLVKRGVPPAVGSWDVPGGFAKEREHPEKAMLRELKEELGMDATIKGFYGFYMDLYGGHNGPTSAVLNIYYLVSLPRSARLRPTDDISDARWFSLSRLPKQISFRHIHQALRDWRRGEGYK
ncbi:MAG: NUDIX hydrolase [Parcubacteria group bacterium]